jgi:hypothetical protein
MSQDCEMQDLDAYHQQVIRSAEGLFFRSAVRCHPERSRRTARIKSAFIEVAYDLSYFEMGKHFDFAQCDIRLTEGRLNKEILRDVILSQ